MLNVSHNSSLLLLTNCDVLYSNTGKQGFNMMHNVVNSKHDGLTASFSACITSLARRDEIFQEQYSQSVQVWSPAVLCSCCQGAACCSNATQTSTDLHYITGHPSIAVYDTVPFFC